MTELADPIIESAAEEQGEHLPPPMVYIAAPAPGIYRDIPEKEYRSWDAVNISSLKPLWEYSPMAYRFWWTHAKKDTPELLKGRALHTLILEGRETFEREFLVATQCAAWKQKGGGQCTSPGKHFGADGNWYCGTHIRGTTKAECEKEVLTSPQREQVYRWAESIMSNPATRAFIENADGANELSIVWKDAETDILCKARIDMERAKYSAALGDLKTTKNPTPLEFSKSIGEYAYDRQAAWYMTGAKAVGIEGIEEFGFIAPEKVVPHDLGCYRLGSDALDLGHQQNRMLLLQLKACRDQNVWPGCCGDFDLISVQRFHSERVLKKIEAMKETIRILGGRV